MDTQKRELWDRLENEPARAFRAFEGFLSLPSGERTLTAAYHRHVGNPDARPSDTWVRWSREFAWAERARAFDDHLTSVRREAYERGIEEEAERQGALAERSRNRMNELLTLGYERAIECLGDVSWVNDNLRSQDVLQIIRLHLDAVKAFRVEEPRAEGDWTEEDEARMDEFLKKIDEEGPGEDEEDLL